MTSVNPTSTTLGTGPITPPAGVKLETPEQEQMYRAALEFERFFVQQLLKPMEGASSMLGGDEEGGTGATAGYNDMAQDQLTQAVLDGGGLGFASTIYGQLAEAAGLTTPAGATPAAGAPNARPSAPASTGGDAA